MATIDLMKYIYCPAAAFELHGIAYTHNNPNEGVACRIKVGPRRFLDKRVYSQQLKLLLWRDMDGQADYRPNEPVDVTIEEDGTLFIDAVALAKKYFGKDNISFCSKDDWHMRKSRSSVSNTVMHTDYGMASSRSTWMDINWNHSGLHLIPGTLQLCGHDVRSILWSSFSDACAVHSEALFPLAEAVLDEPHTIAAGEFLQALEKAEVIDEFGINRLQICTDHGDYVIDSSLTEYITVSLKGTSAEIGGYRLARRCRPLQQVDIMLQLLQAASAEEVREVLDKNHKLGLLSKHK